MKPKPLARFALGFFVSVLMTQMLPDSSASSVPSGGAGWNEIHGGAELQSIAQTYETPTPQASGAEHTASTSGSSPTVGYSEGPPPEPEFLYIDNVCGMVPGDIGGRDAIFDDNVSGCLLGFRPDQAPEQRDGRGPRGPQPPGPGRIIDRVIELVAAPELEIAPSEIGLTGLETYVWIDEPRPVGVTAAAGGTTVEARAYPTQYLWDWGRQRHAHLRPGPGLERVLAGDHRARLRDHRSLRAQRRGRVGGAVAHQRWWMAGARVVLARRPRRLPGAPGPITPHPQRRLRPGRDGHAATRRSRTASELAKGCGPCGPCGPLLPFTARSAPGAPACDGKSAAGSRPISELRGVRSLGPPKAISAKYWQDQVDQVDQVDQPVLGHPISLVNFSGGMHVAGTACHGHDAGGVVARPRIERTFRVPFGLVP